VKSTPSPLNDYNNYMTNKYNQWRNEVNKDPYDDCVSGGTSGCQ
jgi:hypothetical protein